MTLRPLMSAGIIFSIGIAIVVLGLAVLTRPWSLTDFLLLFSVPAIVLVGFVYVIVIQLGDDPRPFEKLD